MRDTMKLLDTKIPVYIQCFLDNIGCFLSPKTIEKKYEKAGKDLAKGAKKAGDAIEDKAEEVGKAVSKGAHNLKKGIEKEKDKFERAHRS